MAELWDDRAVQVVSTPESALTAANRAKSRTLGQKVQNTVARYIKRKVYGSSVFQETGALLKLDSTQISGANG